MIYWRVMFQHTTAASDVNRPTVTSDIFGKSISRVWSDQRCEVRVDRSNSSSVQGRDRDLICAEPTQAPMEHG